MAKFDCTWCGKCCRSFGEFITIERKLTDRDYYCRYGITNELFLVHVQPEFADGISEDFEEGGNKPGSPDHKGCPFSRKNPDGPGFSCAIYPTRPAICREFRCYRMLIHNARTGELRGKVMGISELKSDDPDLVKIWAEKVIPLPHPIHDRHEKVQHSSAPGAQAAHNHNAHVLSYIHNPTPSDDHEWVEGVTATLASQGYFCDPVEE